MPPRTVGALTLALADLRALARNGFGLGVAAVLTGLLVPIMAFALYGSEAMRDMLMFFCLVAQLLVGILLAARVAGTRRSRFVDSLYTTPLQARTWLASQALLGLALCGLLILIHLPFVAVYTAFVGPPHMAGQVLLAAVLLGACSVAMGLFFGVVVGQAGPGAAAGLAAGLGFLSFFGFLMHGIAAGPGEVTGTPLLIVRLTAMSPLTLAADVMGIDPFGLEVTAPWRPAVGLAAFALGLGGAAWLAYVRLQSPMGWEARRGRWAVALLAALAFAVPVAAAPTEFRETQDPTGFSLEPGEHTRITFVDPGAPIADEEFTLYATWTWDTLRHGADNDLDALVMVVLPNPSAAVQRVVVQVTGTHEVAVTGGGYRSIPDGRPDGQARLETDGPSGPLRPVYRVPVTVRPLEAHAIEESPGDIGVHTTFSSGGESFASHARLTLHADVPGASAAMLAAGLPTPLLALGALVTRRLRTR